MSNLKKSSGRLVGLIRLAGHKSRREIQQIAVGMVRTDLEKVTDLGATASSKLVRLIKVP